MLCLPLLVTGVPSRFLRLGFMIRLGAPPDPMTSGNKISIYSSCSKGRPLRAFERGSFCRFPRYVSYNAANEEEATPHHNLR